jgi:hypothetical protein
MMDAALQTMAKKLWAQLQSVSDQSEHITMIETRLAETTAIVHKHCSSQILFRMLCDKFAE